LGEQRLEGCVVSLAQLQRTEGVDPDGRTGRSRGHRFDGSAASLVNVQRRTACGLQCTPDVVVARAGTEPAELAAN